jgi:hypothetical protein
MRKRRILLIALARMAGSYRARTGQYSETAEQSDVGPAFYARVTLAAKQPGLAL